LIIHHLPIAVTFAFFSNESTVVCKCSLLIMQKQFFYVIKSSQTIWSIASLIRLSFQSDVGTMQVVDPTHYEEAVMGGRMTATLNANNDICAIQKAGGEGVLQSVIMQCLRIAGQKAYDISTKIKNAVSFPVQNNPFGTAVSIVLLYNQYIS